MTNAGQTKYEPAIYMCKEAENDVLSKEYHCMHASQGNYGKPSDCNIKMQIQ